MPTDRFVPYPLPSHINYSEYRKNTKPIMEKRRRERINRSLEELKDLILDNATTNNVRSHKLEKADILEMTVKHLRAVYKHKLATAAAIDPTIASKYRAGYGECANEIIRFLTATPNADLELKTKLISHLSARIQNLSSLSILPPPIQPTLTPIHPTTDLLTKTNRYSVNSSTNNQYIFILSQQQQQRQQRQQQIQSSSTTFDDEADCSPISSNNSSDCESIKSEATTTTTTTTTTIATTPTDSPASTMLESPSKVWRPW